uniref:Uncharacterized protein n=1 Tax=Rhizochromulina marina TaxID=1034831 RepID=A0A7S2R942_9STRA|mmetsp:Transcript_12902/g.37532  ORF Transcript_12902/g.37532 Transcript_12902/m.37532 type:complete len:328 (+) Transcript_12902:27-1010(+)
MYDQVFWYDLEFPDEASQTRFRLYDPPQRSRPSSVNDWDDDFGEEEVRRPSAYAEGPFDDFGEGEARRSSTYVEGPYARSEPPEVEWQPAVQRPQRRRRSSVDKMPPSRAEDQAREFKARLERMDAKREDLREEIIILAEKLEATEEQLAVIGVTQAMWRRRLVSADGSPRAIELAKQRLQGLVQQRRRGEAAVDMIQEDIAEREELVEELQARCEVLRTKLGLGATSAAAELQGGAGTDEEAVTNRGNENPQEQGTAVEEEEEEEEPPSQAPFIIEEGRKPASQSQWEQRNDASVEGLLSSSASPPVLQPEEEANEGPPTGPGPVL